MVDAPSGAFTSLAGGATLVGDQDPANPNDYLEGTGGADSIQGLTGDDTIVAGAGNDVADGGEGSDTLDDGEGRDTLSGGAGDDTFVGVSQDFDLDTLTGGTGQDTYVLNWYGNGYRGNIYAATADDVTDFEPGAGGDVIDINVLLEQIPGYAGQNLFTGDYLQLVQNGTATEIQFDPTGTGTDWHVVLTLEDTLSTDLTSDNFRPAYSMDDHAPVAGDIADQSGREDTAWSFAVPAGTFSDVDGDALRFTACLANGDPLPGWVHFDAATQTFSGTPPENWSGTLAITVTAADRHLSTASGFDLVIAPANDAPAAVTLTGKVASVAENGGAVKVADIGVADDGLGTNTLSVAGADRASFEIRADPSTGAQELWFTGGADFEAKASYAVQVKAADDSGLGSALSQVVSLGITNVNEAPTGIAIEGGSVREDAAAGTVVATLGAVDPDRGDSFRYALSGAPGTFEIVGDQIRVAAGARIDREAQGSYSVTLTVTDRLGASHSEDVVIRVDDVSATVVTGGGGNDALTGTGGSDTIQGGGGNDLLSGGAGADRLDGGAGADRLQGEEGNDALTGGKGNDAVVGGKGQDDLWGQGGTDTFVFTDATDSGPTKVTRDLIEDFGGKDVIDLEAVDAIQGRGNQAFALDLGGSFDAGEVRQTRVAGGLLLEMNLDSDTKAEMSVFLRGVDHVLSESGFLL